MTWIRTDWNKKHSSKKPWETKQNTNHKIKSLKPHLSLLNTITDIQQISKQSNMYPTFSLLTTFEAKG
jgi:hypothetical protein